MTDAKSYLVIARKYRPQTFNEVVGQEHVATTLKNAIKLNRIGHAYLFCGPRGVGKTSMARIFAKSLNCKNGPTMDPCGQCPACTEIEESRALDVLEIDGASNRGIDEIRALRENVKFSPAAGKFKIYIIDEVHQITTDGFNALLKTLEEPPAHVKFIFATTSAQKVPATILSRCQRFDFKRLQNGQIAGTLGQICKKEKIKIDEEALFVIAQCADGSLRDGQSVLDQMASAALDKITKKDVIDLLGVLEEDRLVELTEAIASKDAASALMHLDGVLQEGKDPVLFMEKLLEHARNLLYLKVSEDLADLLDATEQYKKELSRQKDRFSKEELFYFFTVITHTLQLMRRFEIKRIPLEMALIKLCQMSPIENLSEIISLIKQKATDAPPSAVKQDTFAKPAPQAIRAVGESAKPQTDQPTGQTPSAAVMPQQTRQDAGQIQSAVAALTKADEEPEAPEELPTEDFEADLPWNKNAASFETAWNGLLSVLKTEKISVATYLSEGQLLGIQNGVVRISFPERLNFHKECLETNDNRRLIERHLSAILNQEVRIELQTIKEKPQTQTPEKKTQPASDPTEDSQTIKSAMNIFGGRIIPNG